MCEIRMRDDFKDIVTCTFNKRVTPEIIQTNEFFDIHSMNNKLVIVPNYQMTLSTLQKNFVRAKVISSDIVKPRRHWVVVGYKANTKLFKKSNKDGINFDISFPEKALPFVGSLDLNGLPVMIKSDARHITRIKEAFEELKFNKVIQLADNLLSEENNSFIEEAKLYKLRAMDKIAWQNGDDKPSGINTDEYRELAHELIDENPSSGNFPEVLMYLSKMYYKLGRVSKGDEFSNILNEEFYDNPYSKIAFLHKADRIYKNQKRRAEALQLYKDVLYNTKNLDIASKAASRLSEKYLENEEIEKGYEFYKKVVDANEPYLQKNVKEAYNFAKQFAQAKKYDLAIQIVGSLLGLGDKLHKNMSDDLRKDIAYWYDLSGNKDAAYGLYKQYLQDYKLGNHVGFIQSRLDKVVLDIKESNITKKLDNIDTVLSKYQDEPIYKSALIEKVKLLIVEGKYDALFKLEEALIAQDAYKFLQYGASKKILQDLEGDDCKSAIRLYNEYNATVSKAYEAKLYHCLMRVADYAEALKITNLHQEDKVLLDRLKWMYYALKTHSKLDNNKKVVLLGEDIEKLSKVLKTSSYDDIVYEKADAYYNLQAYDEMMLREVKRAETLFQNDIRNIDLFSKVLRYAKNKKNDLLIVNYAQKIIALQMVHKIDDYSPNVELDLINALKRLKQFDKALKEDLKLLYIKLTDSQRANVLYLAGELSLKIDKAEEAKGFFIKCGEIVEDSSWQRLCAQSLQLLED
ncbi:MAG: hypothetical protein K0U47_02395 [Epsilonproteobacteria bacterium]|nr:hypothetical protein [Campylobacterota bacterium]